MKAKPRGKTTAPTRGDLVLVHWVDITGDGVGDVKDAVAAECITPGYFYGYKQQKDVRMLVLQLTLHSSGEMRGWDVYPASVVRRIEVLRPKEELRYGNQTA